MGIVSDYMGFEMMKEQLSGEYREAFEAVLSYGTMKRISQDILTERLTELYDTLLTAQSEGREARRVVGDDRQRFCRDIFQDYTFGDSTREQFGRRCLWVCIILILELLPVFLSNKGWKGVRISILPYLLAIVCVVLAELLARFLIVPMVLKSRKIKAFKWDIIFIVVDAFVFAGTLNLARELPLPQWELPAVWLAIGAGAFFLISLIPAIWSYKNSSGSLLGIREHMRRDSYYKDLSDTRFETIWMKSWKQWYEKLLRKGKSDPEDFLRRMKKDVRMSPLYEIFYSVFIAMLELPIIYDRITSNEETKVFSVIFLGTGMVVTWYIIIKWHRKRIAVEKKYIALCEESDLTLPELIEEKLSSK